MELYHKVLWERPENPLPKNGTLYKDVSMGHDAFVNIALPTVRHMKLLSVRIDSMKVALDECGDIVRVEERQIYEDERPNLVLTFENGAILRIPNRSVVDDYFVTEHCYYNRDESIEYHVRNVDLHVRIWDADGTMLIHVPLDEEEE